MSHDHKPDNDEEKARIHASGAWVIFGRINGAIAVSRAIGDWEYKIEEFRLKNPKDLEIRLNQLGAERWQCFWVEQSKDQKIFYFKRTKLSYLSKIPTGALLRIMADFGNE